MKKLITKIIVVIMIVGLNWTGLSAVIETFAYYNDNETSNTNSYQAGVLDFHLYSTTTNFVPSAVVSNMRPGDSVTREISVIKEIESNPFQYNARTIKTGGDDDFCQALKLEAKLDGVLQYSDGLMNFVSATTTFSTSTDDWLFTVTLPSGTSFLPGEVCQIKFVFDGWQINLPDSSGGFNDQEEIASSFATGGMKINKVYYDVDSQHGVEPANEWIEIYNPLDNPVDISGWLIVDNNATDTIPSSDPIPAKGFAIITASSTTWNYWNIPDGVVKIVLEDGKIGNGLANGGDRVILKMPDGTEDDAMSYGTDNYAFVPPCPDVDEGHILARVPNGLDTNTKDDWKDRGLPEVEVIWPNGGEVLYIGWTYIIQWQATNTNGPASDLKIDIWYSRDSGVSWVNIVKGTENDGAYEWRIPLFINGYYVPSHHARIKVVAFGPENFMVQAWDMSDADFCPPIDYSLLTDEEKTQVEQLLADGILTEADIINREAITITEDVAMTTEDVATTTEETSTTIENQEGGIIEEINEIIDEVIDEIVDAIIEEILPETEPANEEASVEETPIIDESTVIEENQTTEETVIEEEPATEEQPVIAPDNNSGAEAAPVDNGSGGETVSAAPSDGATE